MPMKNPPTPEPSSSSNTSNPSASPSPTPHRTPRRHPHHTLSELVNAKRGISPEMAVRLSKVFGGSAESWLTQQTLYDLSQVHAIRIKLNRLQIA